MHTSRRGFLGALLGVLATAGNFLRAEGPGREGESDPFAQAARTGRLCFAINQGQLIDFARDSLGTVNAERWGDALPGTLLVDGIEAQAAPQRGRWLVTVSLRGKADGSCWGTFDGREIVFQGQRLYQDFNRAALLRLPGLAFAEPLPFRYRVHNVMPKARREEQDLLAAMIEQGLGV